MATLYSTIEEKFIKRLVNDKKFFNYSGLTEAEIISLSHDHYLDLQSQAIDEIYKYDTPQIDFYNKDDLLEKFNIDLTDKEIGLIVDICYVCYFREDKNKLHQLGLVFRGGEINQLSPANERRSFMEMLNDMEDKVSSDIIKYLSTDRLTGKLKTSQTQIELN